MSIKQGRPTFADGFSRRDIRDQKPRRGSNPLIEMTDADLDDIMVRDGVPAPVPNKSSGLAAQITPIPCPCCGSPLAVPTLDVVCFTYDLSPLQSRILGAVWRGRGLPVSAERVFDAMYSDDPDGGPETPKMYAAFKEALHRMRAKLEGSGIGIRNAGYRRGYALVMGNARKDGK